MPVFGFNNLVECLQKEEWLNKQSDEWFTKLYTYLSDKKLDEKQIQVLKNLKIIRLENNELASTSKENIFFPLDERENYGFEKEIRVIKRELLEIKKKETKDAIIAFLKSLGVHNAQPYDIIENHILPIYESKDINHNWQSKDAKLLLGYIRYIKDNLQNYEKQSDKRLDPLGRLKKSLYIRINKTVDGTNYYDHPQNIYLPKTFGNENNLESLFEGIENISFVHREYIDEIIKKYRQAKRIYKKSKADIKKRREAEIKEWREFFVKLGVNVGLKLEETDKSHLTSEDKKRLRGWNNYTAERVTNYILIPLQQILERIDKEKAKHLTTLLAKQWEKLSNYTQLQYQWHYYTWYTNYADSTWLHLLKTSVWLPTSKDTLAKPSEVFLDKPEIRELLGDTVPYLTIEIKNENLVKTIGINSVANPKGVLNYLKILTEQKCEDKTTFTKLYEFLNKNYENSKDIIKTAFSTNKIIYLPNTAQSYFTSNEVLWEDVSDIFGENRGYLEKHYPKLKSFFVEKLGVNEKPTPEDYANVLIDLSRKGKVDGADEKIIWKIYKKLNEHLNPEKNEHLISEEGWWNDFISKPIFWTDKEEFWYNDNNVFVNDDPELYRLFKDNPKISFLKLPNNDYPKIQYFIEAVHISYLSKAVKIELATEETPRIEQDLTNQIRDIVPYILRYLYKSFHSDYERLKNDGKLTQLKNLTCYSVESLNVKYVVGSEEVSGKRSSLLYNGNLYIQKERLEHTDSLAIEFSKFFGDIKGLDNFLVVLFYKKTKDKIENYLKTQGIQELPDDEQEWWFGRIPATLTEEGVDEKKDEQTIIEPPPSEAGKADWSPSITPMEAEVRVEQFQPTETRSKAEKDQLPERRNGHGKTTWISSDEDKQDRDTLSPETKKSIGRWGEEYALKCLKDKLSIKYSKGVVKDTEYGFTIICDDKTVVKVDWLNKIEEKGKGYDIEVHENSDVTYIEVKSTKTDAKEWFDISSTQWEFIQEMGDKFHIYRVYNAGTKKATLMDIPNPKKLWQEGHLTAYPIRVKI